MKEFQIKGLEILRDFLKDRPQLTAHGLEKECGLHAGAVSKPLTGLPGRNLSHKTWIRLLQIMRKYGYVE